MSSSKKNVFRTVLSAMFLALALVLPFLTMQIPQIGSMLCPMHMPVLLCGFFCGPFYALGVGIIAPFLRFALFGMPPIMPTGIGMACELAAYGFFSGYLSRLLPKKTGYIYVTLILSMIFGRIVWGVVRALLYGVSGSPFGFKMFIAGAFTEAIPGIIVQIVFIPIIVMAIRRAYPKLDL